MGLREVSLIPVVQFLSKKNSVVGTKDGPTRELMRTTKRSRSWHPERAAAVVRNL
jgi:hypothetical protein